MTSQSTITCRSPSARRSTTARSERPISRWISWVRPDCLPFAASRLPRVWVARGSIPYSAVTQPCALPRRNGGTRSSTLAVHSTRVSPKLTRHEPSAWRVKPGSNLSSRIWSGARPAGRIPTDSGLRLFVDGIMQAAAPDPRERREIERQIVRDQPIEDALAAASAALSGLSQAAGVVLAPKRELTLRQLNFVQLSNNRALAVLVGADGSVENRIVALDGAAG